MSTKETAENKSKGTAEQAREKAGEVADKARQQAQGQARKQKEYAANRLSGVAQALHETGDTLRDKNDETIAQYVDQAAGQVDRVSGYLRDHSVEDLVHDTEHFARRQPGLFLGGAFALGLLASRFLKSSSRGSSSMPDRHQYSRGSTTGGQYRQRPEAVEPAGGSPSGRSESTSKTPGA